MSVHKHYKPLTFTHEETRDQIVRSILNSSKSKSAWTFSKQKRFRQQPQSAAALHHFKAITNPQSDKNASSESFVPKNHSYGFGKSKRKVFTQTSQTPFSWKYNPEQPKMSWKNMPFGEARDKCHSGSYISREQQKIPGPARYEIKDIQKTLKYTMRPKTGHQRTYFIENKQAMQIPGPGKYNQEFQRIGAKTFTSKFRDSSLGSSGIMTKSRRFLTQSDKTFALSSFSNDKTKTPWSKGCLIGSQKRSSFVDKQKKLHDNPGPGNYELPSEFGHYKKISSRQFKRIQ